MTTFSPLIDGTVPYRDEYDSRRGSAITCLNVHHQAGSWGADAPLLTPGPPSANYIIYPDGSLFGQVPEEFRAWTSGSWAADAPAITVEVANAPGAGPVNGNNDDPAAWAVTDEAYDTLCRLLADIAHRYEWGDLGPARVHGHREYVPTACPGGWLWARIQNGDIRTRALAITTPQGEDIIMKNAAFYYTTPAGQTNLIVNTATGIWHEFISSDGGYNTAIARAFDCGNFEKITASHAAALKAACDRKRDS